MAEKKKCPPQNRNLTKIKELKKRAGKRSSITTFLRNSHTYESTSCDIAYKTNFVLHVSRLFHRAQHQVACRPTLIARNAGLHTNRLFSHYTFTLSCTCIDTRPEHTCARSVHKYHAFVHNLASPLPANGSLRRDPSRETPLENRFLLFSATAHHLATVRAVRADLTASPLRLPVVDGTHEHVTAERIPVVRVDIIVGV